MSNLWECEGVVVVAAQVAVEGDGDPALLHLGEEGVDGAGGDLGVGNALAVGKEAVAGQGVLEHVDLAGPSGKEEREEKMRN